jgi:hypothetical protein
VTIVPLLEPPPPTGAYSDVQYTDRLHLAMPGYLNLALVEQLNSNMVVLDRAVLLTPEGSVAGVTLDQPVLLLPTIDDFSEANHGHLDATGGGTLSGNALQTAVTGTGDVVKAVAPSLVGPLLALPVADALAINGDLSGPRRIDWRTLTSQRWSLQAAGGTEPGGDVGSDLNLIYYTDAGTLKGTALSLRRADGRASFPHDVAISGGLTVAGAVSMPNLDVGPQIASGVAAHEAKPDPHPVYATDVALSGALTAHEGAADPHPTYLTQTRAAPLFLPASWGPQHLSDTDPHPSYMTQSEANDQLVPVAHLADPTAHSQYLTQPEGEGLFLLKAHEPGINPHPQYLTQSTADGRYVLASAALADGELRAYIQQIMAVLDPDGPPPPA